MKSLAEKIQYLEFELERSKHRLDVLSMMYWKESENGIISSKAFAIITRIRARIRRLNALIESLINH